MYIHSQVEDCLIDAYKLNRLVAKEIMVVMLSDLDRTPKPEMPHAVPIAYGLTGYSLQTDCMRKAITYILNECQQRGVKVDVVSSDGQFHRLAVRDESDTPLTLLQVWHTKYL